MRARLSTSVYLSATLLLMTAAWVRMGSAQPAVLPEPQEAQDAIVERMHARCIRVVAGDRIEAEVRQGSPLKIQYLGVQLPTPDDPDPALRVLNRKALAFNRELVENKPISLEFESTEPDEAGRLAAYVFVGETFVNAALIRQGYARVADTSPEFQLKDYLQKQEVKAFEEGLGIWEAPGRSFAQPQAPKVLSPPPPVPAGKYLASQQSKVFHVSECPWAGKIAPYNRLVFESREAAIASGRRPCKICLP